MASELLAMGKTGVERRLVDEKHSDEEVHRTQKHQGGLWRILHARIKIWIGILFLPSPPLKSPAPDQSSVPAPAIGTRGYAAHCYASQLR
jgi:hypothetical protein